ncbi:unnamed protein product, partial [Choristocarpus tenellus]
LLNSCISHEDDSSPKVTGRPPSGGDAIVDCEANRGQRYLGVHPDCLNEIHQLKRSPEKEGEINTSREERGVTVADSGVTFTTPGYHSISSSSSSRDGNFGVKMGGNSATGTKEEVEGASHNQGTLKIITQGNLV